MLTYMYMYFNIYCCICTHTHTHTYKHTVIPNVQSVSNLTEVDIGNKATIACLTTGYPLPTISWQKDTAELTQSMDGRITLFVFDAAQVIGGNTNSSNNSGYSHNDSISSIIQLSGFSMDEVKTLGELGVVGVLVFQMVEREDTANYTCIVRNSLPETTELSAVSTFIQLVVLGKYRRLRVAHRMAGDKSSTLFS